MVTQREIAELLEISQQTVSFCFSRPERVNERTRTKVLSLAKRLGYRPNRTARQMARNRFGCVTLVQDLREGHSSLPTELLEGILEGLEESDLALNIAHVSYDQTRHGKSYPRLLREAACDGFLLNVHIDTPPELLSILTRVDIPCIWVNDNRSTDAVYLDDRDAGRRLTDGLLQSGYKTIAFIDDKEPGSIQHYSISERYQGYAEAYAAAGGEPCRLLLPSTQDTQKRRLAAAELIAPLPRPLGLVVPSRLLAENVRIAVLNDLHLLPEDACIATLIGHTEFGEIPAVRLRHPQHAIGRTAADMICRKISAPGEPIPSVAIPFDDIPDNERNEP